MGLWERNWRGLDPRQVDHCRWAWDFLVGAVGIEVELVLDRCHEDYSETTFRESDGRVYLGANVLPAGTTSAVERLSLLGCLAHELAHADRFRRGYRRPADLPDMLVDEAETCLHASFFAPLNTKDREDLVEHASDLLARWLHLKIMERTTP